MNYERLLHWLHAPNFCQPSPCFRAQQQALGQHYVTCTKEDTMMSVWVIRARWEHLGVVGNMIVIWCHVYKCCLEEMEGTGDRRTAGGEEETPGRS